MEYWKYNKKIRHECTNIDKYKERKGIRGNDANLQTLLLKCQPRLLAVCPVFAKEALAAEPQWHKFSSLLEDMPTANANPEAVRCEPHPSIWLATDYQEI
jgi:hypothetical protein